jgi:hypothetical protein
MQRLLPMGEQCCANHESFVPVHQRDEPMHRVPSGLTEYRMHGSRHRRPCLMTAHVDRASWRAR